MKTFKINKRLMVVCQAESTRTGFRHLAELVVNGTGYEEAKCTYQNRTWERYTFESVLNQLLAKTEIMDEKEKKLFAKKIKLQAFTY